MKLDWTKYLEIYLYRSYIVFIILFEDLKEFILKTSLYFRIMIKTQSRFFLVLEKYFIILAVFYWL